MNPRRKRPTKVRRARVGGELASVQGAALEAAPDAIVIADTAGAILWVNGAFRQMTGYAPAEAIGQNPRFLKSGQQSPAFYQELWATILSGRTWRGELVNRRKDGSFYDEEMAITPVRGRGHRPAYFVAVKRDVTQRKQRDHDNTLLAHAVEHSTGMIGVVDPRGRFVIANSALFRRLGYTHEQLLGTSFARLLSPNNTVRLKEQIAAGVFADGGWHGECLARRRDGTDLPVELSVGPVKGHEGEVLGGFGIARDLSQEEATKDELQRSEEQFRQLTDHIREVFFVITLEPVRMTYLSPAYEEIWGRPRQEVYDRPAAWIESVHPEDRDKVSGVFARCLTGEPTEMEYRIVRPGGPVRWIHARSYPVRDATGVLSRVVGIAEDVTEHKRVEHALHESLVNAREAQTKLAIALAESEQRGRDTVLLTELIDVVQACPTVEEAYAVTRGMLASFFPTQAGALCATSASRNIVEAVATWGDRAITAPAFGPDDCWALRRGKAHIRRDAHDATRCGHLSEAASRGAVCVPLAAHGETFGVLCVEYPPVPTVPDAAETPGGKDAVGQRVALVAERLSLTLANVQLRETLRRQSIRDPLTGLFNRRFMEESLERELQRAARSSEPVTVLMLDLDHFKRFNDTYGHPAGDVFLRALGQFLAQRVRGQDLACRYGGEEFLVILAGTTADDARRRADAWREECVGLTVEHAGQALGGVTVSVGIATYPTHGESGEHLINAADQALYRAKAEGRDRVLIAATGLSVVPAPSGST